MKLLLLSVGKPGPLLADAITEFERRAVRYWPLELAEIREEKAGKGTAAAAIRSAESARLLERVPPGFEIIALTRGGRRWSSRDLANYLADLAVHSAAGAAFLVGGACGLAPDVISAAQRTLSLGDVTMPHDVARLVMTEQLYRAGTIVRGEPYHKGDL
ncbi:MAG: 23S rRNA (pseudouridine(1915)-N(3))-methyltransferase RlmH [Longimicrobiales bacterium]